MRGTRVSRIFRVPAARSSSPNSKASWGIDYKARIAAEEAERRWIARKTFIVWTIALMFFAIACQKLWLMGKDVDVPFSDINPVRSLFGD